MSRTSSLVHVKTFDFSNTPVSLHRPKFTYSLERSANEPLISIVTPFYNTGHEFHETAQSVFQQSLQQFEWIIVNDGSDNPESISILESYRKIDPRVRVIDHLSNRGLPAARNTGFREARSDFILFLDSDDLLEPTAAEKWFWFLITNPSCAFVKGYTVGFGEYNYLWARGFHQRRLFLGENLVDITSLVRKSVLNSVGGFDESLKQGFEDWEFWLKCANAGFWGATIPEYHDWYRRRSMQQVRWQAFDSRKEIVHLLRKRYPNLFRKRNFPSINLNASEQEKNQIDQETALLAGKNRLCKNKPRILMIVPWLNLGGADKFNLDLAKLLTRSGWEVSILTTLTSEDPWWQEFSKITPDIFMLHRFLTIEHYPSFIRYFIESRQPDVIFLSNSEFGYLLLPSLKRCWPNLVFIDYCHMEEEDWIDGGYPMLSIKHQNYIDLTLTASEHLKKWMIEHGADGRKIEVCYINVDTKEWEPSEEVRKQVRNELSIPDDLPVLLYAARLCKQKQPLLLANVIRVLAKRGLKFLAIVVGDGPDKGELVSFINHNKLQNFVKIMGALPNDQVRRLMQASDIFFLPSEWEGIALSIYEAMACGLAVVGADVGGQRELVTESCGILLKPSGNFQNDAIAYAQILERLITNEKERKCIADHARYRVESLFNQEEMISRFLYLIEKAFQNRKTLETIADCESAMIIAKRKAQMYSSKTQTSVELLNMQWKPPTINSRLYFWLRARLSTLYNYGKRRGWRWMVRIKEVLVRFLIPDEYEEL